MVLHPFTAEKESPENSRHVVSAWAAVERTQKQTAPWYWLIAQPDHAMLSGDLAASFSSPDFPSLEKEVVQAISLHDAGWAKFDVEDEEAAEFRPMCAASGKPLSFFEIAPADFTRAWKDSIDKAQEAGPIGAILVSKHFCRLGQGFMHDRAHDPGAKLVHEFLNSENQRQGKLMKAVGHSRTAIERLTDILQFCDLLSLYLCCGSREDVEFPQRLASTPIRLRRTGGGFHLEPALIKSGASLGVTARRYPASSTEPNSTSLGFLIV